MHTSTVCKQLLNLGGALEKSPILCRLWTYLRCSLQFFQYKVRLEKNIYYNRIWISDDKVCHPEPNEINSDPEHCKPVRDAAAILCSFAQNLQQYVDLVRVIKNAPNRVNNMLWKPIVFVLGVTSCTVLLLSADFNYCSLWTTNLDSYVKNIIYIIWYC